MTATRRLTILNLLAGTLVSRAQSQRENPLPKPEEEDEDAKLPNGKSQKDAIAKQNHDDALKAVESLIALAEELRDEIKRSGEHVVSISSLKKTEEIEKLARRIMAKLKA